MTHGFDAGTVRGRSLAICRAASKGCEKHRVVGEWYRVNSNEYLLQEDVDHKPPARLASVPVDR